MSLTPSPSGRIFRPTYLLYVAPAREGYRQKYEVRNVLSITTQKSLSSPTGTFEIVMNYDPNNVAQGAAPLEGTSRLEEGGNNRWSDILAPNDYIEIWLGRIPNDPNKIVMRGWIDNVTVSEQAGSTGPVLRITINGRDYGKVWLVTKILNIAPGVPPQEWVQQYQIDWEITTMVKLFKQALDKIAQPYIDYHKKINQSVASFNRDASTMEPDEDSLKIILVSMDYLMQVVYSLIAYYAAKPWIELFVQDYDDAPTFVMRWAPLRTSDNKQLTALLAPYPQKIVEHHINTTEDIVEANLTRSDTDVFNWIRAYQVAQFSIQEQDYGAFSSAGEVPYIIGDSIDMYGLRSLPPTFQFIDDKQGEHREQLKDAADQIKEMVRRFTLWCAQMYGHNYALLNGSMRIRGLPKYRVGEELVVHDKDFSPRQRYYIEGVSHEFQWNISYRTTLSITRGMPVDGFVNGGLATMSPFKLPTSYPSVLDPEFIASINAVNGGPPNGPPPDPTPGKPS